MNDFERSQIMKLQQDGLGYKRITAATGLPVNTVKTICRRNPISVETQTYPGTLRLRSSAFGR